MWRVAAEIVQTQRVRADIYPDFAFENCKKPQSFILQYFHADYCFTHWVKQNLLIIFIYLLPKDLYNLSFLCYFG